MANFQTNTKNRQASSRAPADVSSKKPATDMNQPSPQRQPATTAAHPTVTLPASESPMTLPQEDNVTGADVRPPLTEERIRELAYYKWQTAGSPPGDGVEYWLEAESELAQVEETED